MFDLFGTLLEQIRENVFEASLKKMSAAVGIGYQDFYNTWIKETNDRRHKGEFKSIENEIKYICETYNVFISDKQIKRASEYRYEFTKDSMVPRKDALDTLKAIKKAGLLVGLISDCSVEVPQYWTNLGFDLYFDIKIFSCEVGLRKPDPKIFQLACEKSGIEPEDCLYIGDGFSNELTGASSAGMHAVLIQSPDDPKIEKLSWEGNTWQGDRIESLGEVINVISNTSI